MNVFQPHTVRSVLEAAWHGPILFADRRRILEVCPSLLPSRLVSTTFANISHEDAWGFKFEWTPDHLSLEDSEPLKHSYDVLAEECLEVLDTIDPPKKGTLPRNSNSYDRTNPPPTAQGEKIDSSASPPKVPGRDLYQLFCEHHDSHPKLRELWTEVNTVPPWVDWDQILRGQNVFYRYGGACLTGLAYQSLLGGMGAARVVETLARTGGFSTKVARRRLFETTQHILQCTRSLEALQPGGDGFASSIRVRFLHAAVRNRIMKLAKERPDYYKVSEWGVPINDLDSIATISTFSATLIWLSLPRQGLFLREQEIEDYVALWRYIAHLMGCPTDPYFTNPAHAKAIMETLLYNEIRPSETSALLANNIIKSLDDQPPGYASADFLIASARWLNGNELCDRLGLARPSLYYWALFAGQNLFFCAVCYTYRAIPALDRRKVAALKDVFYKIVVESKYGLEGKETMFDFKYVPEFSTITEMNDGKEVRPRMRGVETRNLKWLVLGVGVLVGFTWIGLRVVSGIVRLAWKLLV